MSRADSLPPRVARQLRAREALRKQVKASCGTCAEHGCVDCHCKPAPESDGSHGHSHC